MKFEYNSNIKRAIALYMAFAMTTSQVSMVASATTLEKDEDLLVQGVEVSNEEAVDTEVTENVVEVEPTKEETLEEETLEEETLEEETLEDETLVEEEETSVKEEEILVEEEKTPVKEEETSVKKEETPVKDNGSTENSFAPATTFTADVPSTISADVPATIALTSVDVSAIADQLVSASTTQVIAPTPTVKIGTTTLKLNADYTLSYPDLGSAATGYNLGVNKLAITGIGLYSGSNNESTFNVYGNLAVGTAAATADTTATVAANTYAYTGEVIQPTIESVKLGNTVIAASDLTITYNNTASTNVGTYTVSITGADTTVGNFLKNTLTYTYKIVARPVSSLDLYYKAPNTDTYLPVTEIPDQDYTSAAVYPDYTLGMTINNVTTMLVTGTDISRAYTNCTNVGTATTVATAKSSNFSGNVTNTFDVIASTTNYFGGKDASSLSTITQRTYTGKQYAASDFTPVLTASTGSKPTLNVGYTRYLALIPATATWTVEQLAAALGNNYDGVDAAVKAEMESALANGGLPGVNTFFAIGMGNWAGSWASQEMTILSSLTLADVKLYKESESDGALLTTATWTGTEIVPGEIVVTVGGVDLVEDTDYTIYWDGTGLNAYGFAGYTTGTMTLTFTGKGAYTGTKTATYTITALNINDANVVWVEVDEDGDAIGLGVSDQGYTSKDIIPNMELRVYYNGFDPDNTDVTTETEYYQLINNSDYTRSMTNRINVGEASVFYKASGSRITGTTRTENFDIVASDENYFGGKDTSCLSKPTDRTYSGKQILVTELSPIFKATNGVSPTLNSGYVKYLALIPSTATWTVEDLAVALGNDYDGVDADDKLEMEEALANGGLPGTNTFLAIGINNYSGSWGSTELTIGASLSAATVELWTEADDAQDARTTPFSTAVWSGTEIVPGEIVVSLLGNELVEDTDYTIAWDGTGLKSYGFAGYTTGTMTLTFTGKGAYSGTKTATYTVTALDINDANVVWVEVDEDGDAIGLGVSDQSYTSKDIIPNMELRVYYNGFDPDNTDVTTETEFYQLINNSDYSRSMTDRINVGEASVFYKASGSRITGTTRTENFDIVASDENYFDGENSSCLGVVTPRTYTGTQFLVTEMTPALTATNGSKPTLNSGYTKYLALIPDDTTNSWGAAELAAALLDEYAALIEEDSADSLATIEEMKAALANGGLPGVNTYLAVGIANWSGSWASQEVKVTADLSKATVVFFDDDQYTTEVTYYYPDELTSGDPTIKVVYGTKNATTGLYTYEVDDTWYTTAFDDLTSSGAKKVVVTAAADVCASSARTGNFTIKGYDFNDENAYIVHSVNDQLFTGYTMGDVPDVEFALTTWDDHTNNTIALVHNVDFTAELVNAINVADKTADLAPTVVITGIGTYSGTLEFTYSITLPGSTDFVIGDIEKQKYTAGFVEPTPAVVAQLAGDDTDTRDLVEGVDFTYSYASNVHAGVDTATITVTGIGNYAGVTESETFSIAADCSTASDFVVELFDVGGTTAKTSFSWNYGDAIEPDVKVTAGGSELTVDTEYTITYGVNEDLGTGTVTITPGDDVNYFGSKVVTFDITALNIDDAGFMIGESWNDSDSEAEIEDQDFSGNYITIADLLIFDEDGDEVDGVTYTVSYTDNLGVGTATVTATGTGNYTGTISTDFDITATATDLFDDAIVYGVGDQKYTGTAITPVPTNITIKNPATGGTIALVSGVDYQLGATAPATDGYTDNILPGVATVNIVGIGSYAGNELNYEFNIFADLANAVVYYFDGTSLGSAAAVTTGTYDWTGADVDPAFEVYFNYGVTDQELQLTYDATVADSMYTITRDATSTDAGDKTITIAPANSDSGAFYKGSLSATYTIDAIDISGAKNDTDGGDVTYIDQEIVLAYNALVQLPSHEDLGLLFGTYELTEDDYTIEVKSGFDGIGTGLTDGGDDMICVITGVGNFTGSFELDYVIAEADVDALLETAYLDTIAAQVFVGKTVTPATKVWVEVNGVNTDVSEFFDFAYSAGAASNAARCTAIGKTGTIYAGGRVETTFRLTGDLSQATMTFDTDDNGVLQVQLAFMDGDDVLANVPASAYTVASATLNANTSTITFKVNAVTSQFYTGSLSGSTNYNLSINTNGVFMKGDIDESGILDAAEFEAVLADYKTDYPAGTPFTDEDNSYTTYTNGVTVNSTGCAAFVYKLADNLFGPGSGPDSANAADVGEFDQYVITRDQLRVGDYYHTGTHWGIFTEIGTNSYKTAEGNVGGEVVYDRPVTVEDLSGSETVFYSRYPYAK